MTLYHPDRWKMLKFSNGVDTTYKVLAGWKGGFSLGDSYQLSSGTVQIEKKGTLWLFTQSSGSVYACPEEKEGYLVYTASIRERIGDNVSIADIGYTVEDVANIGDIVL